MSEDGGGGYDPALPGGGGSSTGMSFPELYDIGYSSGTTPFGQGAPAAGTTGAGVAYGLENSGAYDPVQAGPSAAGLSLPNTVDPGTVDPTSAASLTGSRYDMGSYDPAALPGNSTLTTGEVPGATGYNIPGAAVPTAGVTGSSFTIPSDLAALLSDPDVSGAGATGTSAFDPTGRSGTANGINLGTSSGTKGSAGEGSLWDKLLTGATNSIAKNPLGIAAAATGLGASIFNKNETSPNQAALSVSAAELSAQGKQLASYLQSGTLPAGLQAQVDQAKNAAKQAIISRYASRGQPTDPNANPALMQELQMAEQQAVIQIAQIGQQLLDSGIKESQISAGLYQALANMDRQQQQQQQAAIAALAAAFSGSGTAAKK